MPVVSEKCQHTKAALKKVQNSKRAEIGLKQLCTSLLDHVDVEGKLKRRYELLRSHGQGVGYQAFYSLDLSNLDESSFRSEILPDHWKNAWDQSSSQEAGDNTLPEDIKQFVGQLLTWNKLWSPRTYWANQINEELAELNRQFHLLDSKVNKFAIKNPPIMAKELRKPPKLANFVLGEKRFVAGYPGQDKKYKKHNISEGKSGYDEEKSSDEDQAEIRSGRVFPNRRKVKNKYKKTLTEADAWQLNKFTVALMLVSAVGVLACCDLYSQTPEAQAQSIGPVASAQPVKVTAENQSDGALEFIVWMVLAGIFSLVSPDTSAELASAATQTFVESCTRSGVPYASI